MRRILLLSFSLMLSIFASAQDIQTFVQKQMETYPKSRLLDIYKSCFQDYMGAEHLVSDRQRVKVYLDEELQGTSLDSLLTWLYEPCGVNPTLTLYSQYFLLISVLHCSAMSAVFYNAVLRHHGS